MGEGEAMRHLSRESYLFATYAYRTLFPKRVVGAHDGAHSSAIINGLGASSHVVRPAPDALTVALQLVDRWF